MDKINTKEEFEELNNLLTKKRINYCEFNTLIGNYFVKDYEELEENYYLLKIITNNIKGKNFYTDYVQIIK